MHHFANESCHNYAFLKKAKDLGAKILAENCGQTFEKVMKDFDRDYWMNARQAIDYGIADQMVEKL